MFTKRKFPNKALVSRIDYVLSNLFSRVVQGKKKASFTNTGISCTIKVFYYLVGGENVTIIAFNFQVWISLFSHLYVARIPF